MPFVQTCRRHVGCLPGLPDTLSPLTFLIQSNPSLLVARLYQSNTAVVVTVLQHSVKFIQASYARMHVCNDGMVHANWPGKVAKKSCIGPTSAACCLRDPE